jgi:hypothetical protein
MMRAISVIVMTGVGCSSNDLTAGELLHGTAAAFCEQAFACRAEFEDDGFEDVFGASREACEARFEAQIGELDASVAAGRIRFDPEQARRCLDGLDFGTCREFWGGDIYEPPACELAMVGTVVVGGACTSQWDCAGEATCSDGVCVAGRTSTATLAPRDRP